MKCPHCGRTQPSYIFRCRGCKRKMPLAYGAIVLLFVIGLAIILHLAGRL